MPTKKIEVLNPFLFSQNYKALTIEIKSTLFNGIISIKF